MPQFPLAVLWCFTAIGRQWRCLESPGWGLLEAEKVLIESGPEQERTLAVLIKLKTAESNSLLI